MGVGVCGLGDAAGGLEGEREQLLREREQLVGDAAGGLEGEREQLLREREQLVGDAAGGGFVCGVFFSCLFFVSRLGVRLCVRPSSGYADVFCGLSGVNGMPLHSIACADDC